MTRPEISHSIQTGSFKTNYHDLGDGDPLILVHGSGPGVSAWANWRLVMPELSKQSRVLALDYVGFGYTEKPESIQYGLETWVQQTVDFMDALNVRQANFVGNSFGGALALAMAVLYPERVRKVVLMGAMGVDFPITRGLSEVWGYQPSIENMKKLLTLFVDNKAVATDELAETRYRASIEPGFQEAFGAMFPEPMQNSVKAMAKYEDRLSGLKNEFLIVHGREDQVIPMDNSLKLLRLLDKAELHIFGHCGHWTQIEKSAEFAELVNHFLE